MQLVAIDLHVRYDLSDLAIDAHARVTRAERIAKKLAIMALAAAHEWCKDRDVGPVWLAQHGVDHLIDRLLRYGQITIDAELCAGARKKKANKVVDLRNSTDRRTWCRADRLLLDGNGGREAIDEIDIRSVH